MRPRSHQHGHRALRIQQSQLDDALAEGCGLLQRIGEQAQLYGRRRFWKQSQLQGRRRRDCPSSHTGYERNRAGAQVVLFGEHLREGRVRPLDQLRHGAKIACQLQRLQSHATDTAVAGSQEQSDLRLSKLIDRLHRIAHYEQRATVPLIPGSRERLDEIELSQRGILKLIHQNVPQREPGAQRQIGG